MLSSADPKRLGLLLGLLSFSLYAVSITFGFVDFDDQRILLEQRHLFATDSFTDGLRAIFTALPREEPLIVRDVSWLIESHIFGFATPSAYHLGNVLLNAACTSGLFWFLVCATRSNALAALVTGLWLTLPVHVEPVCWVMGRKDLLATFFMLAALLAQDTWMDRHGRHRAGPYALSLALVGLAVLSKINAATFFAVMGLYAVLRPYLRGERPPDAGLPAAEIGRAALALTPHAAISVAAFLWYRGVLSEYGILGRGPSPLSVEHLTTLTTLIPLIVLRYVELIAWPTGIAIFYDRPAVGVPTPPAHLIAALGLTLSFGAATIYSAWRRRDLLFYLAALVLLMLPYLNLVYIGIVVANRYIYLASAMALALAATVANDLVQGRGPAVRRALLGAVAVFVAFGAAQSIRITGAWRDNVALWSYEAALPEPSLLALQALARVHVKTAERAEDPRARLDETAAAEALVSRGFEQVERLAAVPVEHYFSYQRDYTAKLHHWRGRVAALKGAPPPARLPHFEAAYALSPSSRLHAKTLAETLHQMARAEADPDRRLAWARGSLRYFDAYIGLSLRHHGAAQRLAKALHSNYSPFPELGPAIAETREKHGL